MMGGFLSRLFGNKAAPSSSASMTSYYPKVESSNQQPVVDIAADLTNDYTDDSFKLVFRPAYKNDRLYRKNLKIEMRR